MRHPATCVAIDVGTTKICTLVGQPLSNGEVEVTGVGVTPAKGLLKGVIVDLDDASEAIRASVQRAERSSGTRILSAHVGITGSHVSAINSRSTVTINRHDRLVTDDDVARVLEGGRSAASFPSNREVIHVVPRSYVLDGLEGVRNPVGLYGFRLDAEVHIILGAVTSIQNLTKCVENAGVRVENLVLEPLASAEAVLSDDERETGVALVDVGGGTTDVAVFFNGSIGHTAVLPLGGNQFTQDLVIGLRTPFAAAEQAKITAGSAEPAAIDRDQMVELNAFGAGGTRPVSRRLVSEILRARSDELIELAYAAIRGSGYNDLLPAGFVFTGGAANLLGLAELAEQTTKLPARVGVPGGVTGLVDTLRNPAYATSVGLLHWAARYGEEERPEHQDRGPAILHWLQNLLHFLRLGG